MDDGLVLVWDIDQTLSGQYFDPNVFTKNPEVNPYDYVFLNPNALKIIEKALKAKSTGRVSAIGLFTNNGNEDFISLIKSAIEKIIGIEPIFDFTITANRPNQTIGKNGQLVKTLAQIQDELPTVNNLVNRVYFFDDMPDHVIREEIPADHYIQITPPYDITSHDTTNWSPIETALDILPSASKGGRRMRRPAKKSRRRHKKRSRQSRSTRDGSS
jgi:hypothetical protein